MKVIQYVLVKNHEEKIGANSQPINTVKYNI